MKNTFYSQGNPYNIVRVTGNTHTASVNELIIADETEITLPSGVPAGSVIAVRSSGPDVTTDVVGASDSVDGFSQGTTHQEAKTGEYVYDGSDWYLRNSVDVRNGAIPDSVVSQYSAKEYNGDNTNIIDLAGSNDVSETGSGTYNFIQNGINGYPAWEPTQRLNYQAGVSLSVSQPYTIFAVADTTTNTSRFAIVDTGSGDTLRLQPGKSRTVLNAGDVYVGSPDPTANPAIYTVVYDGANTLVRENGTEFSVGNIGNAGISKIELFYTKTDTGLLGFVELHDGLPSNGLQKREQEIADDWDITI